MILTVLHRKLGTVEVIMDPEDFEKFGHLKWRIKCPKGRNNRYAYCYQDGKGIAMHRMVTGFTYRSVDHINRNTLDNRKSNLREGYHGNTSNSTKVAKRKLDLPRGVHFRKGKFVARIRHNTEEFFLGYFDTIELAHSAYMQKSIELKGEFSPYWRAK